MQRSNALLHIQMHHHGGVMPVRPGGHLGIPRGIHEPQERIGSPGSGGK